MSPYEWANQQRGYTGPWASTAPQGPKDSIVLPSHYARFPIEPIRFIVENKLDWFQGNIVKYTMRYDAKNGLEDLEKARRYNEMQQKYLKGEADWWK